MDDPSFTPEPIDVVFSFDTTGSMYPCLTQVRRKVRETAERLYLEIPGIRVGIIAHGDYCDDHAGSYVIKTLDPTDDILKLINFVENVQPTGGGDAPECYELVLNQARSLPWRAGRAKVLVVIGDDVPHPVGYRYGSHNVKIDWRNELGLLLEAGINVYGVHAMPEYRRHSKQFYTEISQRTGGFYVTLDEFSLITDLVMAICFKQDGDAALQKYEEEVKAAGRMNRSAAKMFSNLTGRAPVVSFTMGTGKLAPVPPGRFQVLEVDEDCDIKGFVLKQGLSFKKGRGFYEFTKKETVQEKKEVILRDRITGDMFTGDQAREMIGLPYGMRGDIKPTFLDKYMVFVQSTSVNRKLIGHTRFLYEVEDWDRAAAAGPARWCRR